MDFPTQPTTILNAPQSNVSDNFDQLAQQERARLARLKNLILIFLGPILLVIWLKAKLGVWWPEIQLLNQFWQNPAWIFTGQFSLGWWVGWLILKLDHINSKTWYQSSPITRSVSFCLVLLVLGVFVMTSTDSWLGIALILSLWSQLSVEIFIWQARPEKLAEFFLHDVQPDFRLKLAESLKNKAGYLMMTGIILLIMTGLL